MCIRDRSEIESYLKSQKIFLDISEFKYQLHTHPDNHSLLAFSDALTFFNIPNLAIRISIADIEQLPESFIALVEIENKVTLQHIKKDSGAFSLKKDKKLQKLTKDDLAKIWKGIVLLTEKNENVVVNKRKKIYIPVTVSYTHLDVYK